MKRLHFLILTFMLCGCAILQNPAGGLTSGDGAGGNGDSELTFQAISRFSGQQTNWTSDVDRIVQFNTAFGDLDNDGVPELLIGYGGVITIYTINSEGEITDTGHSITVSSSSFKAVDFDGDGNQDVIAITGNLAHIEIFWGDGSFGFTVGPSQGYQATTEEVYDVGFGDFDSDTNLDMMMPRGNGGDDVLICHGGGLARTLETLGSCTAIALTGGDNPRYVEVGLLNGDAIPDVIIGLRGTDEVLIATGDGASGFAAQTIVALTAGSTPWQIAYGDLDGDTFPDIAVNTYGDNRIELIYADDGTATSYTLQTNIDPGQETSGTVIIDDIDSNGVNELIFTEGDESSHQSPGVRVYSNDGIGNLTLSQDINTGGTLDSLLLFDLDGDAGLDLFAPTNPAIFFKPNTTGILFEAYPNANLVNGTDPVGMVQGDWDGDGDLDLAVLNQGSSDVQIMENDGDGVFTNGANYATDTDANAIAAGDFDGDGFADFAVVDYTNQSIRAFINDGVGNFNNPFADVGLSDPGVSVNVGQVDSDGFLDLIVALDNGDIQIYHGDGTGDFTAGNNYTSVANSKIIPADLDGDGNLDFVACNTGGVSDQFIGDGTGAFTQSALTGTASCSAGAVADFDGDDFPDFVYSRKYAWQLDILINDASGNLGSITNYTDKAHSIANSMVSFDIDLDGNLDWVTTFQYLGGARVYYGDGAGGFSSWKSLPIGTDSRAMLYGDYNGDYRWDLAILGNGDQIIQIFFGQ